MIKVRKIEAQHWENLKAVRLNALKTDPDAFGTTLDQVIGYEKEVWIEQIATLPTFLLSKDEMELGMVRLARDKDDPANIGWLISMWVAPELRGTGASVLLVENLISFAKELGLKKIFLDVADYNLAATKLYKKLGFTETGVKGTLPAPRTHITESQMSLDII